MWKVFVAALVSSNSFPHSKRRKKKGKKNYGEKETWACVSSASVYVSAKHGTFVLGILNVFLYRSFLWEILPKRLILDEKVIREQRCATGAGIRRYRHIRYLATSTMTSFTTPAQEIISTLQWVSIQEIQNQVKIVQLEINEISKTLVVIFRSENIIPFFLIKWRNQREEPASTLINSTGYSSRNGLFKKIHDNLATLLL